MIEIFIGEDTQSARKALNKAIESLHLSESTNIQRFSDVGLDIQVLNEAVFAQNLFGQQNTIVLDAILDAQQGDSFYTEELRQSPNQIFIREAAPNKDILKIFKKIGEIHEFPLIKKVKFENNFAIADAVAAKNKKSAWVEYIRATERGSVPEEIHGTIFWATKLLYLCATREKEEAIKAGVNPNNYQRYLNYSKAFLEGELEGRLRELKDMYHSAHRGEADFDVLLEQYLLRV